MRSSIQSANVKDGTRAAANADAFDLVYVGGGPCDPSQGCDASVLLDGRWTEKAAGPDLSAKAACLAGQRLLPRHRGARHPRRRLVVVPVRAAASLHRGGRRQAAEPGVRLPDPQGLPRPARPRRRRPRRALRRAHGRPDHLHVRVPEALTPSAATAGWARTRSSTPATRGR